MDRPGGDGVYGSKSKDTSFRRTWDRDEYEKRARERSRLEREAEEDEDRKRKGLPPMKRQRFGAAVPERDLLRAREEKVNFEAALGKTQAAGASGRQPGFYCKVCDCVLKDNVAYLDHINGKKHQRALGMSMKVERSTLEQVRARIQMWKDRKRATKSEYNLEERIAELKQQEEDSKRLRREKKQERKARKQTSAATADLGAANSDMAAMMGFSGFGTSKQ